MLCSKTFFGGAPRKTDSSAAENFFAGRQIFFCFQSFPSGSLFRFRFNVCRFGFLAYFCRFACTVNVHITKKLTYIKQI